MKFDFFLRSLFDNNLDQKDRKIVIKRRDISNRSKTMLLFTSHWCLPPFLLLHNTDFWFWSLMIPRWVLSDIYDKPF